MGEQGTDKGQPHVAAGLEAVVGQSVPSCCVPLTAREGQGGGHQY